MILITAMRMIKIVSFNGKIKLITGHWDISLNGYQLGNHPDNRRECNLKILDITKG